MVNLARVSVITPVFNGAKYLDIFLNLVANQTYSNFEWIIVDDGSTDHTKDKILNFLKQKKITNIKYIFQNNSGVSSARNKGLSVASGDYIMFADVDDHPHIDFIEKYLSTIIKKKVDAVIFAINQIDGDKITKKTNSSGLMTNIQILKNILQQVNYGYLFSVIAKRTIWQDVFLNQSIYFIEDEEVLIRILLNTNCVYCSLDTYYDYFVRNDSVMNNLEVKDYKNGLTSTRLMKTDIEDSRVNELIPAANARILGALIPLIILNWRLNNLSQANCYIKEFVRLFPQAEFAPNKKTKRKIQYFIFKHHLKSIASIVYKGVNY